MPATRVLRFAPRRRPATCARLTALARPAVRYPRHHPTVPGAIGAFRREAHLAPRVKQTSQADDGREGASPSAGAIHRPAVEGAGAPWKPPAQSSALRATMAPRGSPVSSTAAARPRLSKPRAALPRAGGTRSVRLTGLAEPDIAQWLRRLETGGDVDTLADRLRAGTGGSPLFRADASGARHVRSSTTG